MKENYQALREYFLKIYQDNNGYQKSEWYSRYRELSTKLQEEIQVAKSLSDDMLRTIWHTGDNGVASLKQAFIPIDALNKNATILNKITQQVILDDSIETYNQVSRELILLKAEGELARNYKAIKNRLYALIYPNSVTSIAAEDKFDKMYNYLNKKFNLSLPKHGSWYERNIALKQVLHEELSGLSQFNDFIINIMVWDVFQSLDNSKNNMVAELDSQYGARNRKNGIPLNQILYGPPGTGKTYHTICKALEILGIPTQGKKREELKASFDKEVKAGRIVFTTFHQSMCYEDFIEGIKPVLNDNDECGQIGYQLVDGVLKYLCVNACYSFTEKLKSKKITDLTNFSSQYDLFVNQVEEQLTEGKPYCLPTKNNNEILIIGISENNNLIIRHANGEKNYIVSKNRLAKLNAVVSDLNDIPNINVVIRDSIGGCNTTAYWAVLNRIRQQQKLQNRDEKQAALSYEEKAEIVKQLEQADYQKNSAKPYVLIIDEINRGNVSQIFGELITLLEEDKRLGNSEALTITLPYSKEPFGVPNNLYIIGTMNTADRSVEALDTALRRRFSFTEMLPDAEALVDENGQSLKVENIELGKLLETINERLELLLDKDHQIGHSYFFGIDDKKKLSELFNNKIVPLLQEYFFNDYAKIGLVLGKGFVEPKTINADFGHFDIESNIYGEKKVYQLNKVDETTIISAIELLMPAAHPLELVS